MADEKLCKRGEVWYFTMTNNYGRELLTGRPCIVLSDCDESDPMVTVMFMTTTVKEIGEGLVLTTPKKKSWALVSQIQSYDKDRLRQHMCTLTEYEMAAIDEAVARRLSLSISEPKIEEPVVDSDGVSEVDTLQDQITSQQVTIAAYKKLYDKLLEMYTDLKIEKDTSLSVPIVKEAPIVVEETPIFREPELDLSALQAKFKVHDERQQQKSRSKVNVNTATAKEIAEFTGMNLTVAYSICGTRNRSGVRFEKLEDLLICERFKESHLKKYGDMLEI